MFLEQLSSSIPYGTLISKTRSLEPLLCHWLGSHPWEFLLLPSHCLCPCSLQSSRCGRGTRLPMPSIILPVPFTAPQGYSEPNKTQEHLQTPVQKKMYEKVVKDIQGQQSHAGKPCGSSWEDPEQGPGDFPLCQRYSEWLYDQATPVWVPKASSKYDCQGIFGRLLHVVLKYQTALGWQTGWRGSAFEELPSK